MENKTNRVAPRDLLERALASPNGVRIFFLTQEEAISMRNRMNAVKTEDRKKNNKVYAPTDLSYNSTPYDDLAIVIKSGLLSTQGEAKTLLEKGGFPSQCPGAWLYVLPSGASDQAFIVEEL